jgi:dihydropteroate synthase
MTVDRDMRAIDATKKSNLNVRFDSVMDLPGASERLRIVGILNVTPDSFSDGGRWLTPRDAASQGVHMHAEGADLIDVGGESTRPGAFRVSEDEELRRILPVVRALRQAGVPVSVDTTRSRVARSSLEAGATMINDVSGGTADPGMASAVMEAGCPWILMHNRGSSATMQALAEYTDVVGEVADELSRRIDAALAAGVAAEQIVIDPGLGFAKRPPHNWRLLAGIERLTSLGFPVLIGASRKSFLGRLLADEQGNTRPVMQREDATTAITTYAALAGVWGVRVHDVRASADAALAAAAIGTAQAG